MDVTASTIKYVLFVCNFLFVVSGIVLVIYGFITIFSDGVYSKILDHDYSIVGVFLVIIGLCIFGVTFFGCWGALYEKYSMLYTYGILLSVLLLLQLIFFGIILYLTKNHSGGHLDQLAVEKFFHKYLKKDNVKIINYIDNFQEEHLCCGVAGPTFWDQYGTEAFPRSCCPKSFVKCGSINAYQKGCLNDIKEEIASKFKPSFIIYSIIIQIFVIGSTFYLAREMTTQRSDYDAI